MKLVEESPTTWSHPSPTLSNSELSSTPPIYNRYQIRSESLQSDNTATEDDANSVNMHAFTSMLSNTAVCNGLAIALIKNHTTVDGSMRLPQALIQGFESLEPIFTAAKEASATDTPIATSPSLPPSPTPTPAATSTTFRTRKPRLATSGHAAAFWGPLMRLRTEDLVLDPAIASLLAAPPHIFFAGTGIELGGSSMLGMYRYSRALSRRRQEDSARSIVVALAWAAIIARLKPLASPSGNKPRLTAEDRDWFYDAYFAPSSTVVSPGPTKLEVLRWFEHTRNLAVAYTWLTAELGNHPGGLLYVAHRWTECGLINGLSRKSRIAKAGVRHLKDIGLGTGQEAVEIGRRVEGLVEWILGRLEEST